MATMILLDEHADLYWLFETHLAFLYPIRKRWRSAMLYGNEDAPERVDLYVDKRPLISDIPTIITL